MRAIVLFCTVLTLQQTATWGQRTANHPASLLGLVPPVDIVKADYYSDGGTRSAILRDAKGKELKFYVDWRIGTKTPGRITGGTSDPNKDTEEHHAPGSPFAIALRDVFEQWLSQPLLAPVWKLSKSDKKSTLVFKDILKNPSFDSWQRKILDEKKWPYEKEPWDHIYWILLVYDGIPTH